MKKITLLFLILLTVNFTFAQKGKVSQASGQLVAGKLDIAKKAIDEDLAANDDKTKTWYKAWFIRGQVYQQITDPSFAMLYKNIDKTGAETTAYEAYMKALEYAKVEKKAEKIKKQIYGKIFNPEKDKDPSLKSSFITKGAEEYQEKKFEDAVKSFETALSLTQLVGATNYIDSAIIHYTGLASDNAAINTEDSLVSAKYYKKAIEYYTKSIAINFEAEKSYGLKSNALTKLGDKDGTINTINEGLKAFPSSKLLIGNMINYYIQNNQMDKALESVSNSIKNGNDDPSYLYTKGALLDKQAETYADKAKELFTIITDRKKELFRARNNPAEAKKVQAILDKEVAELAKNDNKAESIYAESIKMYDLTLAKKADYFDAAYNKGAIYYNIGSKHDNIAGAIPLSDKSGAYDIAIAKATENYKKALDAFLAANKINDTEIYTLRNLRGIYLKLKMTKEYKETDEKINNL